MKKIPRISQAEFEVLSVLWRKSPLTANAVFNGLGDRSWKLNTVRTFLTRLAQKGAVRAKNTAEGKTFAPRIGRDDFVSHASQSFLDRIFGGATASLLIHFVKNKRLSKTELAELQAILDEKRRTK